MKKSMLSLLILFVAAFILGAMPATSCAAQDQPSKAVEAPSKASSPAEQSSQEKVNINKATVAELEKLPGIGPKTAELVIQEREKSGGFKSPEDMMKVNGIGEKKFEKIKDKITIE